MRSICVGLVAVACRPVGASGTVASVVALHDAGGSSAAHRVDREDPVVAGSRRLQAGVGIRRRGGVGVGHEIRPRPVAVRRVLDAISRQRRTPVVARGRPGQVDLRRAVSGGGQRGRRTRDRGVRRGGRDVRSRAGACDVDRGDPVVPGCGGCQADIGVRGPLVVAAQCPPTRPVGRGLDPVAGDLGPAVVGRRVPGEIDPGLTIGGRGKAPGRAGHGRVGGGVGDVGWRTRARRVNRGDPIVPGRGRAQAAMLVGGRGVARVGHAGPPAVPVVSGDLDPVPTDRRATIGDRCSPRKIDLRPTVRRSHQVARRTGHRGFGDRGGDSGERAGTLRSWSPQRDSSAGFPG